MSDGRSGERTVWAEDDHLEPEPEDEEIPVVIICDEDEGGDDLSAASARRPVEVRRKPGARAEGVEYADEDFDEDEGEHEDDIDEELLLGRIEDDLDDELAKELSDAHRVYRVRPRVAMGAAALLVAGILLTLTIVGWKYYGLSTVARYFHPLHDALRPSGSIGLTLGVVGTLLMAASLLYLLRKRFAAWHVPGTIRDWLDLHVLAGLIGPAFIVFHSAFAPTSALGVLGLGSMCIILLSGAAGRWIQSHVPRSLGGHELEFEVIRRRLVVYQKKLVELGVDPELLSAGPAVKRKRRSPFLIESIVKVIWGDRQSRREYARLRDAVRQRSDDWESMERVLLLAWKLCMEQQALARYRELRKLVGTWRFFHRWFAIVLFVAIAYHAAVALRFGNLWGE